jgi:hypothetical protein
MVEMEPRFKLANIKLCFGGQGVTQKLLEALGIDGSCLLHGDYYRLTYEVWPHVESCGPLVWQDIGPCLRMMLLSRSKKDWDESYHNAVRLLQADPLKLEKLDKIYGNPSYYAGYYLRIKVGKLNLNGSTGSEQNHASTQAHIGPGGAGYSIMDNVCALVKRETQKIKSLKKADDLLHCRVHDYQSAEEGQRALDDVIAKQSLSKHAYDNLYTRAAKYASYLKSELLEDGSTNVWPAKSNQDSCIVTNVKPDERCTCCKIVDFVVQCGHELVVDKRILLTKNSNRWFNSYHYYSVYRENLPSNTSFNCERTYEDIDITLAVENTLTNPHHNDNECEQEITDVGTEIMRVGLPQKISYHDMVKKLTDLARTVQFKQEDCITVMTDISKMIDQYRSKRPFVMNLTTFEECAKPNEFLTLVHTENDAVPASTSIPPITTKRKQSLLEFMGRRTPKTAKLNEILEGNEIVTKSSSKSVEGNVLGCPYTNLVAISKGDVNLSQLSLSQSSIVSETRGNTLPLSLSQSVT